MKNRLAALSILLLTVSFMSCSDDKVPYLQFDNRDGVIRPGMTAEIVLTVGFEDDTTPLKPGRTLKKQFSEAPAVSVSDPGFKIVSVKQNISDEVINGTIIIRAGDELISGRSAEISAVWGGLSAGTTLNVKKNPADYLDSDGVVTDPAAYDVLVNKKRMLPGSYIPPDLVRVDVPTILVFEEVNHLRKPASDALNRMFAAAEKEKGFSLLARSGYRSYKTQVSLYDQNVAEYGAEYASRISAKPGTSEHQSGLVMDISSPVVNYQLTQDFGKTAEGKWVAENAHRFGFILRYPEGKEEVTGYTYEPWHLRWVGEELAGKIYAEGLTLEEYFGQ